MTTGDLARLGFYSLPSTIFASVYSFSSCHSPSGVSMPAIKLDGFRCFRCGNEWWPPSGIEPVRCSVCTSLKWNVPLKATPGNWRDELVARSMRGRPKHRTTHVKLKGFRCTQCEYTWLARRKLSDQAHCPQCRSTHWNERTKRAGTPGLSVVSKQQQTKYVIERGIAKPPKPQKR